MSIVEAEGASYVVGGRALVAPTDLRLARGETVAVLGPNGAGKTTLVRLLSGEARPSAGRVVYGGSDARALQPWRLAQMRAVMAQAQSLAFPFSVAEVVGIGLDGAGARLTAREREALVAEALARADVAHLAARTYQTLSGGEQQRAQFARALVQIAAGRARGVGDQVLFLDEPVASLDLAHQIALLETARACAADGIAVLAVLHDLNLAARFADRLVVMAGGAIVADGAPRDIVDAGLVRDVFGIALPVRRDEAGVPFLLPQRIGADARACGS